MRIAVLPPTSDEGLTSVENYFLRCGVETLLTGHELVWFIPEGDDENALLAELNRFDAVVFLGNSMFSSGNHHGFQWKADHIRLLKPPVIALALGLPAREAHEWTESDDELIRALHRRGAISVADKATRDRVAEIVGKSNVRLTGCPSLWMETPPLAYRDQRRIFFPATQDPAFHGRDGSLLGRLVRSYYGRLRQGGRVLFMVEHPREFELGARPGLTTLFSPHFPEMHLKAVTSASAAIGFKMLPLLAAVANNVPAIFLGNDPWAKSMAETAGIPFLEITLNTNAADLCHRTEDQLRKYPWDQVREKVSTLRAGMVEFLKERSLAGEAFLAENEKRFTAGTGRKGKKPALVAVPPGPAAKTDGETLHLCTIADSRYLPFFLGLVENTVEAHPGPVQFHLLALDDKTETLARQYSEKLPVKFYSLSDLWTANELPRITSRQAGLRAFSSKARLLARVLRETGGPVLYADVDVYFYQSPAQIAREMPNDASALLFPHWGDSYRLVRRDGLYNAGMVLARQGAEPFLEWWAQVCWDQCELRYETGHVGDQAYLDFAPVLFPNVAVYRHGDQNVAKWNLHTLSVTHSENGHGAPAIGNGRLVKSFHAAIADDAGFYEVKYVWDQLVGFFGALGHVERAEPLFSNTLYQQKPRWLALGRFLNANEMLGENFWPAAHRPGLSELRFFVSGPGRFLVRWLARARRPAPTTMPALVRKPVLDLETREAAWVHIQRAQCLKNEARGESSTRPAATASTTPRSEELPMAAGEH